MGCYVIRILKAKVKTKLALQKQTIPEEYEFKTNVLYASQKWTTVMLFMVPNSAISLCAPRSV